MPVQLLGNYRDDRKHYALPHFVCIFSADVMNRAYHEQHGSMFTSGRRGLLLCFSAILLLCYSASLLLCYSATPLLCFSATRPFCYSATRPLRYSAIWLLCYSAIRMLCYSAILLPCNSATRMLCYLFAASFFSMNVGNVTESHSIERIHQCLHLHKGIELGTKPLFRYSLPLFVTFSCK